MLVPALTAPTADGAAAAERSALMEVRPLGAGVALRFLGVAARGGGCQPRCAVREPLRIMFPRRLKTLATSACCASPVPAQPLFDDPPPPPIHLLCCARCAVPVR